MANTLLPSYRILGQQVFFSYRAGTTPSFADGERIRWSPQFYYYAGPFGLLGEYADSRQDIGRVTTKGSRSDTVDTSAWQLSAAVFLTGENETYFGFTPKSRGLNWWLNQNFRWMLDYEVTRFDGGAPNGGDRLDERALLTRLFLAF